MTDTRTVAERQLEIAVEALRKIEGWTLDRQSCETASNARREIAALAVPAQPDLAEIGATAYCKALQEHQPPLPWEIVGAGCTFEPLRAAYAAMRAADEEGRRKDVATDPRVRELREAAHIVMTISDRKTDAWDRLRAALAAFETEPQNG
jgi:hypothetical protein